MQVLFQTDDHIHGGESLQHWAQEQATAKLARFRDHITRIEVFVTDVDAGKSIPANKDKRCKVEARLAGLQPITVTADGLKVDSAYSSALEKLVRALDTALGRLRDKNGRDTIRVPANPNAPE